MKSPEQSHAEKPNLIPWLVFAFCLLAFLLRIYVRYGPAHYLFYGTSETGRPESDAVTWFLHTLNMLDGRGFGESVRQFYTRNFVPPGHPFILGAIHLLVGHDPIRIGWVVAILSSLLPLTTFLWVREMWGPRIGLWASFLTAIHAPFMHISFSLMSEPMALLSGSVALYVGARAIRRQRLRDVALAGLVFGVSALVRPAVLAFLWGAVGMIVFLPRVTARRKVIMMSLWLVMTFLPQGAWQIRNYRVHGEWSFVYSSISARHAWTGVNPEYQPYFYSRPAWHETMWRDPDASEMEYIKRMQREAKEWIRADRFKYVMSCIWRMRHLTPELHSNRVKRISFSQGGWGEFYFLLFVCLAPLGAVIAMRTKSRLIGEGADTTLSGKLWGGSLLFSTAVAIIGAGVYGASARYRWPLEYIWIPFLALFMDRLVHMYKNPLFGAETFCFRIPRLSRWMRYGLYVLALIVGGYLIVYSGVLVYRRGQPPVADRTAPIVSAGQLETTLRELGLWEEWSQQTPIRYESVFAEQKENYGEVITAKDKLVVWWGFLRLPILDASGYRSGYIVLEPDPDPLGTARLDLYRHPDVAELPGAWQDGQVVTVFARLTFRKKATARPLLLVYKMLPGRLARDLGSREEADAYARKSVSDSGDDSD
jgi:hypothetical protein